MVLINFRLLSVQVDNSDVPFADEGQVSDCEYLVVKGLFNEIKAILVEIVGDEIILGHVIELGVRHPLRTDGWAETDAR